MIRYFFVCNCRLRFVCLELNSIVMANFQNQSVAVYQNLSKVPSLDSVSMISDYANHSSEHGLHWQAKWSHKDIGRTSKVAYASTGVVTSIKGQLISTKSPFVSEITNEKMIAVSSSNLKAVLREIEVKSEKHYYLEVWNGSHKVSNIDLNKEDKHGIVHTNSVFGCLNWSHNSRKIVYVAERKPAKSKSFFDKNDSDSQNDVDIGKEFVFKEDWGEQLVGTFQPSLFIYEVHEKNVEDFSKYLPKDQSIGCALWSKDDKFLYILGWNGSPWKIGLIFCKNRYSTLYKLNLETKELTYLTDGKSCVFSPILTPDGSNLLYLESTPLGPHRQCVKLCSLNLTPGVSCRKSSVVVDVIDHPSNANCFQGLYIDQIKDYCWLSNGHELIVSSLHRSNIALLCINISTGKVKLLETEGAWTILRVEHDVLFASYSTPNTPPVFKAGRYNDEKIEWIDIDAPVCQLEDVNWEIVKHEPVLKNEDYPGLDYESVLVKPLPDVPIVGLIVNPHGGPHSCFVSGFDVFTAAFSQLGFAVLRVNYRGSIGFGQNNVYSLPKNVGNQDVSDVQHAAETVAKDLGIPTGRIFVQGGSHGGFLTLHLIGQYPEFYRAAATRNPVTNFLSKTATTDIMDWTCLECGEKFNYSCVPTPEELMKRLKYSPIVHVSRIQTPILFMLGLADRRVPPTQSIEYIRALKGLGKNVSVLSYKNNNHSIAKVDAEADCFVNMAKWFWEYKF